MSVFAFTTSPKLKFPIGVVTLPSSSTVTCSRATVGFPLASLLASTIAVLTFSFSVSVNFFGLTTSTGVAGFFNFWVTTSLAGKFPLLSVVTLPLSSTCTSAGAKCESLFASETAFWTSFCSSVVKWFGSVTVTGVVGLFNAGTITSFGDK